MGKTTFDSSGAAVLRPSPASTAAKRSSSSSAPNSKRGKVANFHSDDERDLDAEQVNDGLPNGGWGGKAGEEGPGLKRVGKVKKVLSLADKKKLREEAERLKQGREKLPVSEGKDAILDAIAKNDTVVVLGETGSGKTTQVPQFLLRSSTPCPQPRIVCTQPRRVAAQSLAARVSAEAGCPLGSLVGYTVRFDDRTSKQTRLKYATDGALLAEMLGDKDLDAYDVVILDEAHERSLRTDMLMGFLKAMQRRRRAKVEQWEVLKGKGKAKSNDGDREPSLLKIVVMSATIDAQRFSDFFDKAPILYVQGRLHKVKVLYAAEAQNDYVDAALKTIFRIHTKHPPGDILVFLPGQDDIESLASSIKLYEDDLKKSYALKGELITCPLYAKLSPAEQAKAFLPARTLAKQQHGLGGAAGLGPEPRKVILSTNVAETSVTIPGIKYVVDSGKAKEKEFHASVGIDSLIVEDISQSSARQRMGRAGREADGVCFRLYTEADFVKLPVATKPEIQRVSLTFALLHLLAAGQENVWTFDYMDRPAKDSISAALLTLHGLGALDKAGAITKFGRQMAALPLDPVYAKILLSSFEMGCPKEVIELVALLGSRDSLLPTPFNQRDAANAARAKFAHRRGDHLMLLNVLRAFEEVDKADRKEWCKANFVSLKSMGQVLEAKRQLVERCTRLKLDCSVSAVGDGSGADGEEEEKVLGACLAGLFGNVALMQPDGSYKHAITRQPIYIHPGSLMYQKRAPGIMYDELILTTKTYARGVSGIELAWLRSKAPTMFDAVPSSRKEVTMEE